MKIRINPTILALVAGLIGGVMSRCLFDPMSVRAQVPVQAPAEIRAQRFVLVDENGTVRAVFGFGKNGLPDIQIRLKEPKGLRKIIQADAASPHWIGANRDKTLLPDP